MEIMRNFTEIKENRKYMVFEADNGAAVDTAALGMLENNDIAGMLPFTAVRFNDRVTARYDITGYISVAELLGRTLTGNQIVSVTEDIIRVFDEAEDYLMNPDSVLLDAELMFYDEKTGRTHLCINPFISENTPVISPEQFFRWLICNMKFDSTENCDYIGKMLGYLNSSELFSMNEFRKIIISQKISFNASSAEINSDNQENSDVSRPLKREPEIIKQTENYYAPEKNDFMSSLSCLADDDDVPDEEDNKRSLISRLFGDGKKKKNADRQADEKDDDLLMAHFCDQNGEVFFPDSEQEGTVVINKPSGSNKPCLVRLKGNERIEISSRKFRIGADGSSVDYCIDDNCAVSRVHAEIIKKNNSYYIIDNNSTNHTYVDNQRIRSRKECRILNNTRIKLADEEFTFLVSC